MRAIINSCTVRYAVVVHITSGFTGFSSKDLLVKLICIVNIVAAYKQFFPKMTKMRNCIIMTSGSNRLLGPETRPCVQLES